MAESLVILPALISLLTLFFGGVFLAAVVFLLENRMDETLICFSYRARSACEKEWQQVVSTTALRTLQPKARWVRNGKIWSSEVTFEKPWGGFFQLRREIHLPLTEN